MEQVMGKEIKKLASKTNRSLLKLWSSLLVLMLGILGLLSGCDINNIRLLSTVDTRFRSMVFIDVRVQVTKYIADQTQNQNAE